MMSDTPQVSNRQRFREFMQATDVPPPICMPLCSGLFPQSFAEDADGGRWNLQNNLAAARHCGYIADKLFYDNMYVFDTDHALGWQTETVGEFDGQPVTESRLETPHGPLVRRNKRIVEGRADKDHAVKGEEDLRRVEWVIRARTEATEDIKQAMRDARQIVGEEAVLIWLLAQTFELGYVATSMDDCILLSIDYPEAFARCMEAGRAQHEAYIPAVAEAGVDVIMVDSAGTELFSPALFEQYILPSSLNVVRIAHDCGLPMSFHTCGRPWTWITKGYYNQILPDIFESTSGPPEGDVLDQRQAREIMDPRITIRGSVSLDMLRMGTPEQVYDEATRIMDAFRGYKHILAGTCETMSGTPPENMAAMVRAAADWTG